MNLFKKILVVLLALYIAVLLFWWTSFPKAPVIFTIPPRSTTLEIARVLRKSKIISSETMFRLLVKISGNSRKLKSGIYEVFPRTSIFSVVRLLVEGKSKYLRVTIPEGFTANQIAERLGLAGIVPSEKFAALAKHKELEGYLFPDTYYFELGMSEEKVADKMLNEFNKNFTPQMEERAGEIKMTKKDIVTLASIVEKEAVVPGERPRIAGIFYNRLKKHWYLESCATVLYALGKHKENLTYKDLKINSPYNTYKRLGLPRGPICSPGLPSINAALYPEKTNDMFFVASSSGAHAFSRYYDDHLKNKQIRKKNRKKRTK